MIDFPQKIDWHGCYSDSWKGEATPESHAHPAKFSRGLIRQIYDCLIDNNLLKAGDTVLDPFGGVALGAADALRYGVNWVGVELEQKFVDLGAGCDCTGISQADWVRFYGRWDKANHKDGRHWCPQCLAQAKEITPPSNQPELFDFRPLTAAYKQNSGKIPFTRPHRYNGNIWAFERYAKDGARAVLLQGDSRHLLEVLRGARVSGVLSSPPYADIRMDGGGKYAKEGRGGFGLYTNEAHDAWFTQRDQQNLGNLRPGDLGTVITSSPYVESLASDDPDKRGGLYRDPKRRNDKTLTATYGNTPGQVGAMGEGDLDGVLSSPPYEASLSSKGHGIDFAKAKKDYPGRVIHDDRLKLHDKHHLERRYGESQENLGQTSGDTFWSAARLILEQCYLAIKPGSPAVFVTKDFVKDGQRVPFSDQWARLCAAVGLKPLVRVRAWLVEDRGSQYGLNGQLVTKTVQRKSFFRRLAEKNGSPRIDWEDVLIFVK